MSAATAPAPTGLLEHTYDVSVLQSQHLHRRRVVIDLDVFAGSDHDLARYRHVDQVRDAIWDEIFRPTSTAPLDERLRRIGILLEADQVEALTTRPATF